MAAGQTTLRQVSSSMKVVGAEKPLANEELAAMHAYCRAANYLSVGQIYLMANPLLREPLKIEHIKPRLLAIGAPLPA